MGEVPLYNIPLLDHNCLRCCLHFWPFHPIRNFHPIHLFSKHSSRHCGTQPCFIPIFHFLPSSFFTATIHFIVFTFTVTFVVATFCSMPTGRAPSCFCRAESFRKNTSLGEGISQAASEFLLVHSTPGTRMAGNQM